MSSLTDANSLQEDLPQHTAIGRNGLCLTHGYIIDIDPSFSPDPVFRNGIWNRCIANWLSGKSISKVDKTDL